MNDGVEVVHVAVFVLGCAGHEHKILIVLNGAVEDSAARFQAVAKEAVLIVAGGRYADDQLVRIGLHGLLEKVVLLRLLIGVQLVTDGEIAVERILRVGVSREGLYQKAFALLGVFDVVMIRRIYDLDLAAVFGVLFHTFANVKIEEIKRLQRLFQRGADDVCGRAAFAVKQ